MNIKYPYLSVTPSTNDECFNLTFHLGSGVIERNPSHSIEICQLALMMDPPRIVQRLRTFADELEKKMANFPPMVAKEP